MLHPPRRFRAGCIIVASCAMLCSPARATEAWENGRAYTAAIEKGAAEAAKAVAAAAATVVVATADVARARSNLAAAGGTAVGTSAATLAALAQAEAALASATATLAAAQSAAAVATAVVVGASVGTYIGQGLRGLWDLCWDPVCSAVSLTPNLFPIYRPADPMQLQTLLPTLTLLGSNASLTHADFLNAGSAGLLAETFILQGAHMTIGAARGAAASTAGRHAEVLTAVGDLKTELVVFRGTVEAMGNLLEATVIPSPVPGLSTALTEFVNAASLAKAACAASGAASCAAMGTELDAATAALQDAGQAVAGSHFPRLSGGEQPAFADLSVAEFHQFLDRVAAVGTAGLPAEEVALMNRLAEEAGVTFEGFASAAALVAAYDAAGDTGGRESALFDAQTGLLSFADLLRESATTLRAAGTGSTSTSTSRR
jgi:hypothetical protein